VDRTPVRSPDQVTDRIYAIGTIAELVDGTYVFDGQCAAYEP
jgi:hypothetical protein